MSERDFSLAGDVTLGEARAKLEQTSEKLSGLEGLLRISGKTEDAASLEAGSKRFSRALGSLEEIQVLLDIADKSFTDEGARVSVLLRAFGGTDFTDDGSTRVDQVSPEPSALTTLPTREVESTKIMLDRLGQLVDHFNKCLPEWIRRECHRPVIRRGVIPYETGKNFSAFNLYQQTIVEAFFKQEGGLLTYPAPVDAYVYYLQQNRGLSSYSIYESSLWYYYRGYCSQAGQVLHKIQYLGSPVSRTNGLKKFREVMDGVITEYEDILGIPITPEILEGIALRERMELLPEQNQSWKKRIVFR